MGKGGTGKSTVAAALGLAAVRAGKRVLICEIAGRRQVWDALAGGAAADPYAETEIVPGLHAVSIDPESALEEYLRSQLPSRALFELLRRSRMFQYLVAAAPGARELLTIGKVWETAQLDRPWTEAERRYDLVVVDAPATGHGLALLNAPRTFGEIARVGRIRRQAGKIDGFLRDPQSCGVIGVSLCEELPVSETAEFAQRLRGEMALEFELIVANALLPDRFSEQDAAALRSVDGAARSPIARNGISAALREHSRAGSQREHLSRLAEHGPITELPQVFAPELGLVELTFLSEVLERAL